MILLAIFFISRDKCPLIKLKNKTIHVPYETKYLGIVLDKQLTWNHHLNNKIKMTNIKLHLFRNLLKFKLKIQFKIILNKTIIRPVWSYSILIRGLAKASNICPIQVFQNINLRIITEAPWYIINQAQQYEFN